MGKFRTLIYRRNKLQRIVELSVLYILFPVIIMSDLIPIPLMPVLLAMGLSVFFYLRNDAGFDRTDLWRRTNFRKESSGILLLFVAAAIIMLVLIWFIDADKMFYLPRKMPWLLLLISIFYPLFSVLPQGLAYRALFFHRYADLIPNKTLQIIISALFFSFGHVLYKNWMVLGLTFLAGLLFAYRYVKTKSLLISVFEHALWGVWLFASGLRYFFVSSMVE